MQKFICWLKNLPSTPQRWMARYLRKRGWVAFYLDPHFHGRKCDDPSCWLNLYWSDLKIKP